MKLCGPNHPRWKGGRLQCSGTWSSYILAYAPGHPHAHNNYVLEHRLVAEQALGHVLDRKHDVHHVNGDPGDNRPQNLVVCESRSYHFIIESRTRAYNICGHADWLRCSICQQYGPPGEVRESGHFRYHRACAAEKTRRLRARRHVCP